MSPVRNPDFSDTTYRPASISNGVSRQTFLLVLLVITASGAGLFFYLQKAPCEAPLTYKIGVVDPGFKVSTETFKADVEQASQIWEKAIGKELFVYDPKGELTVNLVYDERQQLTQKEQELSAQISETSQVADSVRQQYSQLRTEFTQAESQYNAMVAAYTQHQAIYNKEVQYWNSKGGAPKEKYDQLNEEKDTLAAERSALEAKRQEVNRLADEVNAYIKKYNLLVAHINTTINTINNDGLAGTEFEEGLYISDREGQRINIFQFANKIDLIRVLAHEFGHSLTLEHNSNPDSIMSPVNQSDTLTLSAEDLRDLMAVCEPT